MILFKEVLLIATGKCARDYRDLRHVVPWSKIASLPYFNSGLKLTTANE